MTLWRSSCLWFLAPALLILLGQGQTPPQRSRLKSSPHLTVTDLGSWKPILKGAEFRKVSLERSEPYHTIDLKIVRFDTRWVAPRVVRSLQYNLKGANVRALAQKSGALAMINANYFDKEGRPLGFLKAGDDRFAQQVSKSALFNGIFGIKNRLPFIARREDFAPQQADEGLQAGPLLIAHGAHLFVARGAGKQSRRSVIAIDKEQRLIIAVADSLLGGLNWIELQELFGAAEWQVNASYLLNLDGGGSTQLYLKGLQLEEHVPGTTEVPVAVGFFPR